MKVRCYRCGKAVDANYARRRYVAAETIYGNGSGASFNEHGGFSAFNSGSSYQCNRMVDLCGRCAARHDSEAFWAGLVRIVIIIGLVIFTGVLIWRFNLWPGIVHEAKKFLP